MTSGVKHNFINLQNLNFINLTITLTFHMKSIGYKNNCNLKIYNLAIYRS